MGSKLIYRISIAVYVLSLVLPVNGNWFGGVFLLVLSGFFSYVSIGVVSSRSDFEFAFGHVFMLLPFFNIFYIFAAVRFKFLESLITPVTVSLTLSALVAVVFAVFSLFSASWFIYPYYVWCLSLVLMCIAIIMRWRNA